MQGVHLLQILKNHQQNAPKGWLAIVMLKPLSLFNSQLLMLKKAFDNVRKCRVAELGSLSSGAKMAMKIFVNCVVFARNRKFAKLTQ